MLRQNPHNVHEWHKRVKLFDGQPERQIKVFAEAVATVDPDKVHTVDSECPYQATGLRHRDFARAAPPERLQFLLGCCFRCITLASVPLQCCA